jgi:hypothetical protein
MTSRPPTADSRAGGTGIRTVGPLQEKMVGNRAHGPFRQTGRPKKRKPHKQSDQSQGLWVCVRTSILRRPFIMDLHRGTLSPRQLAAFLTPCKTALRREQRQRHSRFLFRFRLFWLFNFPVGSSLPFRHKHVSLRCHPGIKISAVKTAELLLPHPSWDPRTRAVSTLSCGC